MWLFWFLFFSFCLGLLCLIVFGMLWGFYFLFVPVVSNIQLGWRCIFSLSCLLIVLFYFVAIHYLLRSPILERPACLKGDIQSRDGILGMSVTPSLQGTAFVNKTDPDTYRRQMLGSLVKSSSRHGIPESRTRKKKKKKELMLL